MPSAAWVRAGNSARMVSFSTSSSIVTSEPRVTPSAFEWIPFKPSTFLIFTMRFGETTYSFIRLIKSVPPASTAASFQLEPSSPIASRCVVG